MISAYNAIVSYEEDNWEEFLDKLTLFEIFKPVISLYLGHPGVLKPVMRYIVWAYSKDSDKVIIGDDWQENKKRIFDAAMIPPMQGIKGQVLYLKSEAVLQTIQGWLDFQQEDAFSHLMMLKELKLEMQLSANSSIRKSSGEIDYDQKYKNSEYVSKLRQSVKDLEAELIQNDIKLKESAKEVRTASRKVKNTFGVENFSTT